MQQATKHIEHRENLINRLRMTLADDEQARLIRLQLHRERRKRIEAGIRALGICGRLRGDCRAFWTRRTLKALNKARRVNL